MKTNLLSKKIHLLLRLLKAFFLLSFLMLGVKTFGQYSGTGTFAKVTSVADVTDGYYVIAYGTTQAMNSTYTSTTYFANTAISPVSGTTITNPSKTIVWKIETSGTGKSISSADTSVFASYTGSSNNIQAVTSVSGNNQRWSFSYTGGLFAVQNLGVTTRYLQYNSGSPRFACYTGSQQDITLYKLAATPTLTVNPTSLTGFTYVQGSGTSSAQSYNLKGTDLTGVITVTAPTNFEVSKTSGGAYAATLSYTAAEGNATAGQTVYVRLKSGLSAAAYGGATTYVTNASAGATTKNVSVSGSVMSPATYTLTYNGNDHTSDASTVPANATFTGGQNPGVILANPTSLAKTGYTLASWYSIANGVSGGVINTLSANFGPAPMPSNDITLYARWKFTVTYDRNGGSGSATQDGYYNGTSGVQSGTMTTNNGTAFTRTGYTFAGWKTTSGGTAAEYTAGATYTHSGTSATKILYAHWIPNVPTFNVNPSSLSGFTYVEGYGPSGIQSFTLTGSDLQNTDTDPVELITINDNYEIAESATGPWSYAIAMPSAYLGAQKTFFVRLKAGLAANASYADTVLISGGSASEASFAEVNLSGSVTACLAPTVQSVVSSFSTVGINGMTINLTPGNGNGRVVVINTNNSFTNPSDALPSSNSVYSGSGEQVVYANTGNSVVVTGLSPSTTYYYSVYEYKLCSGLYLYNTTSSANNPRSQITACDTPVNPNGEVDLENPYCGSATLVYQHGASQPQSGVTYYWQTTATGTSTANPVTSSYSVTASGDYYVRAYNGFCWSADSFKTNTSVVISTAAGISTQPTNQIAAVGATAVFAVTASGSGPFTYQWQESSTGLPGSWVNVGTNATLSLANVQQSKNGYKYQVIVSNACNSKTSDVVTLSVNLTPVSIWSNDITAANPSATNPYTTGDVKNANIVVSGITRGSGLTASSASGRFSATGWSTSTLDANDYFEFTLTPDNNYEIDFSSFQYTSQISGGASTHAFRSSLDGFTSDIGTPTVSGTTVDLSASAYQKVKTAVTFRFYTYGVSAASRAFSINDFVFTGNVVAACTPAAISSFPTSGPAHTLVTLTGSNFTATSAVKFGTVPAVVEYVSATQIKALVPVGANGNILVDTSLDCDSETSFTLINSDTSNCEMSSGTTGSGSTPASDLIIYEVYDENGGTGGMISFYNGTNTAVNLSDYNLYRASTYGSGYGNYASMSGTVAPGGLAAIGVGNSPCGYTAANGTITSGFNDNDGFQLRKNAGATIVDDVRAPNYAGYYMRRKITDLAPTTTYNDAQWTTESLNADQCIPADQIAQVPGLVIAPVVNTQPAFALTCDVANASLSITAAEGFVGGNALAYQWYVLGTSGTWAAISDTGVYTGANSQTLNISDVAGLNQYQYYCQVRENTATCYTATQATQVKEAQNTWSNGWSNGIPVLGSKVIIAGSYDTETNGPLDVCELTVNSNASVRVKSNFPLIVKKKITNLGTTADNFVVESDANLIQQDNVTNTGKIKVERNVLDMNNVTGQIDYVYWSSPVSGQVIKGALGFSPNTPANGYLQYNEINDKFVVTSDPSFLTGKGYAIRAESGTNGYNKVYNFTGTPNNGNIQYQSLRFTDAAHGFNLVGNPYPSNIDFNKLHAMNSSNIYSTAWFWTNNSYTAGQVGSGYSGNNYAMFNGTGGSPATSNPSNPFNNSMTPDGKIKVGQAFIVQAKASAPLDFNNGIRVTDNGGFFQKTEAKSRFWLTLTSPNTLVNTILIGYVSGATDGYETDFDGELFAIGSDSFYSILGARKLAIQGKADRFSVEDKITLGNVYSQNGNYKIALKDPEGLFYGNQMVYLKDKLLKKTIKLNDGNDYTFQAVKGTDINRFEIVYKEDEFLTSDSVSNSAFEVYRDGSDYVVTSSRVLDTIEVYDTSGRLLISQKTTSKSVRIAISDLANGVYIIKAENSGDVKTKKIIK